MGTSKNISPELMGALQSKMGGAGDAALRPPTTWENQKDPSTVEKFLLPEGQEKRDVAANFMQTLNHTNVRIVSIERIQNVSMWQSYAVKRQTVLSREQKQDNTKTQSRFERAWLFHGCHPDVVPNIMQQGFNRSFCGRNATAYGKGVYFARDAPTHPERSTRRRTAAAASTSSLAAWLLGSTASASAMRSRPTCGRGTPSTTRR